MEMISARLLQALTETTDAPTVATTREAVAERLRIRARGVSAAAALRRTVEFYRSSGHRWALALA